MYIGCHLSAAKGYAHMGKDALSIGANTFQFFTRNPRGARAKALDPDDMRALLELMNANAFGTIVAHAPYTLNACSSDPHLRELARDMIADDLERMEHLPGNLYNFHPGSHTGQGVETGIAQIADMLNSVLRPGLHTTVLLETMAGKGSEVGGRFEELREILDRVELNQKMGVCLDTCHVWDGGYDIANHLDEVLDEFDRIIGLSRLKAIHLNNTQNPLGAHKDRHATLTTGHIPLEALIRIINHPALRNLPYYLETPNDLDGYAAEIALMRDSYIE